MHQRFSHSPSFISPANPLRMHSVLLSRSLIKLLNRTDPTTDLGTYHQWPTASWTLWCSSQIFEPSSSLHTHLAHTSSNSSVRVLWEMVLTALLSKRYTLPAVLLSFTKLSQKVSPLQSLLTTPTHSFGISMFWNSFHDYFLLPRVWNAAWNDMKILPFYFPFVCLVSCRYVTYIFPLLLYPTCSLFQISKLIGLHFSVSYIDEEN